MKQIDNRQNKLIQTKAGMGPFRGKGSPAADLLRAKSDAAGKSPVGTVYGLVKDLVVATRIVKSAGHCHLGVHNVDRAESLMDLVRKKQPLLIFIDWDQCEAEAFKFLKELAKDAELKRVPTVGFVSQTKSSVKGEAERAGCHRVYFKSEFLNSLEDLFVRYAL